MLRPGDLKPLMIEADGLRFEDKKLPPPKVKLVQHPRFTPTYFVALGNIVSAPGYDGNGFTYAANTPNFMGARIPLAHTELKTLLRKRVEIDVQNKVVLFYCNFCNVLYFTLLGIQYYTILYNDVPYGILLAHSYSALNWNGN